MTRYVLAQIPTRSPASAQLHASTLRSFLRFLWQAGEITCDLAAAIPAVRRWRLVDVPKYLRPADVTRLLNACDRTSPVGRRDYAILLLLARLGLRGGEIVRLELDDLDWHTGELTVRGKGSVRSRLPLPCDVGEALATYLRRDRPRCATRRVFVRVRAPHRGLGHPSTVNTLVRVALSRAGGRAPMKGAHLLRHSLATELLRQGASLTEIGDVLRHQQPQTTEIYAKVDLTRLHLLAQRGRQVDNDAALRGDRRLPHAATAARGHAARDRARPVAFAAYAERERAEHVTTDLVLRWASQLTSITSATVNGRFEMIRRFAQWRQLTDPRTEIPPADLLPGRYRRQPPRLYREEDIPQLLEPARQLPSAKRLRGRTYAALFGLLVVTGLRSSEVVALDDTDVDRREATLLIRRTKFGKSRLGPIHASTVEALTSYQRVRDQLVPHRRADALFVSERGGRITQWAAEYTFARVSAQIGLRPPVHASISGPLRSCVRPRPSSIINSWPCE